MLGMMGKARDNREVNRIDPVQIAEHRDRMKVVVPELDSMRIDSSYGNCVITECCAS